MIKCAGDVLAGCDEQGCVKPGEAFTVEMNQSRVDFANQGDNVGLNFKGLYTNNVPSSDDVMT